MKRTLKLAFLTAAALLTLALVAACGSSRAGNGTSGTGREGGSDGSSAGGARVAIANFAFSPDSVEIKAGESVTWTNNDSATHTVTGEGGIDSGDLADGQTYTKTFDTAGTYSYKCSIHPTMTGTVVVE